MNLKFCALVALALALTTSAQASYRCMAISGKIEKEVPLNRGGNPTILDTKPFSTFFSATEFPKGKGVRLTIGKNGDKNFPSPLIYAGALPTTDQAATLTVGSDVLDCRLVK